MDRRLRSRRASAHRDPTPGYGYEAADPYQAFLPRVLRIGVDASEDGLRAVVFVTADTRKGTSSSAQEYDSPRLVLAGAEYAVIPFQDLHDRLSNALRGGGPPLTLQIFVPGSASTLVFADGCTTVVPDGDEPEE